MNIVMEYAEGGMLESKIKECKKLAYRMPKDKLMYQFAQLVIGLMFMHSKNILHRDIKPQNIFMSARDILKLGDFGISKDLGTTTLAKTYLGTPYYMAPEICQGARYGKKADIWALGVTLYEMATNNKPFQAPERETLK